MSASSLTQRWPYCALALTLSAACWSTEPGDPADPADQSAITQAPTEDAAGMGAGGAEPPAANLDAGVDATSGSAVDAAGSQPSDAGSGAQEASTTTDASSADVTAQQAPTTDAMPPDASAQDSAPPDAAPNDGSETDAALETDAAPEPTPTCSPGALRCSPDRSAVQACGSDGEWATQTVCKQETPECRGAVCEMLAAGHPDADSWTRLADVEPNGWVFTMIQVPEPMYTRSMNVFISNHADTQSLGMGLWEQGGTTAAPRPDALLSVVAHKGAVEGWNRFDIGPSRWVLLVPGKVYWLGVNSTHPTQIPASGASTLASHYDAAITTDLRPLTHLDPYPPIDPGAPPFADLGMYLGVVEGP